MGKTYALGEKALVQLIKMAVGEGLDLAKTINGDRLAEEMPWSEPRPEQYRASTMAVKVALEAAMQQSGALKRPPSLVGPDGKPMKHALVEG